MVKFSEIRYRRPKLLPLMRSALSLVRRFRKAADPDAADGAFRALNDLIEAAGTMYVTASIRNTVNMKDPFYDREMKFYNRALPMLAPLLKPAIAALLKSPFRPQLEETYGSLLFKTAETQTKLLSGKIILPMVRENMLTSAYAKTVAGCSVDFRGETCNFYGLLRHMQRESRAERKAAFEAWAGLYERVSPKLEAQYRKLVKLRCGMAKTLGYPSYIDYVYLSRGRYDYTAADVEAFRAAVKEYIVPLCAEMYAAQKARLGLEKLEFYDEGLMFPAGNAMPQGTPEILVERARNMYAALSPETKEFFDFMTRWELYDLVTKENKHLGGYCTGLPSLKAPFIFSNFNGTAADVDVLTHEAGHAFEFYYASRTLPITLLASSTSEINEIHSMAMEHFAYPYMELFFGEDASKYRFAHFCGALKTIPYLVAVDAFQHRVFEHPSAGPADWRRFWKEIEATYLPWRSYDGNAFLESGGFWMQKQHIFLYPFYYIDYALAQLGAFALYRRQTEGADAWSDYLKLCACGGKYGYFETLARAGIPNPLRRETVRDVAAFARDHARRLKEQAE